MVQLYFDLRTFPFGQTLLRGRGCDLASTRGKSNIQWQLMVVSWLQWGLDSAKDLFNDLQPDDYLIALSASLRLEQDWDWMTLELLESHERNRSSIL